MARRPRDYAADYARRITGLPRGQRQAARGHGPTGAPEHPERVFRGPEEAAKRPAYLARLNDRRAREGKAPIVVGRPPNPAPGTRQLTVDSIEEAERRTEGPPPPYKTIYIWAGGITAEKRSGEHRRRRAA